MTDQMRDEETFAAAVAAAHAVLGEAVTEEQVIQALRAAGAAMDEHDQAYADRLIAETGIAGLDFADGQARLRLVLAHELAARMTLAFQTILDAQPAVVDYIEQELIARDGGGRYVFIVCKPDGRTPHQLRRQAEEERDQLQRRIDNARAWLAAEVASLPTGDERNLLARLAGFVDRELFPGGGGEGQGNDA